MIEWLSGVDPAWVLGGYGMVGLATTLVMFGALMNMRDGDRSPLLVLAAASLSLGCGMIWPLTWVIAILFAFGWMVSS